MPEEESNEEFLKRIAGTATGTGVEIGGGYATDILTAGMLAGGPLGWLGYAATNFASGAATNWAAQKLRGEEDISWGELISSGLVDIIPFFGQKLKGAKSVANVALQSGARTAAQLQGETALDDQRWLTPRETLEAATIGGVFGTAVTKALPKGYSALRSRYGKYDLDDALQRFPGEAVQEMIKQGKIRETPREAVLMLTEKLTNDIDNPVAFGQIMTGKRINPTTGQVIEPSRSPLPMPGGEIHLISEKKLVNLKKQETFRNLSTEDQQKALDTMEPIDEFAEKARKDPLFKYNPASPTKGFKGIRKFTTDDGRELAVAFRGGQWKVVDPAKNQAVINKRYVWAHSYSSAGAKKAQAWTWSNKTEENKQAKRLLDQLLISDDPADQHLYSRIAGGTQPFQVEHIGNQDSDVWIPQPDGSFRHRYKRNEQGQLIAPGDDENLRLVGIYDFKYLKDGIEKKMKSEGLNGKYHLEMDKSNNIVIMDSRTDQPVTSRSGNIVTIHRSTDPEDGWKSFNHIINGGENLPLPRSEDVRRTVAEWALDPEGGKLMTKESRASMSKRDLDIEDHYKQIKKIQRDILKLDPRKTEKKDELEGHLKDLQGKLLQWIDPSGHYP